jgi:hypothetical protein
MYLLAQVEHISATFALLEQNSHTRRHIQSQKSVEVPNEGCENRQGHRFRNTVVR